MKTAVVAAVLALGAAHARPYAPSNDAVDGAPHPGWRLIRFSMDGKPVWLSPESVESLPAQEVGFADVTEVDPTVYLSEKRPRAPFRQRSEFQGRAEFDAIMAEASLDNILDNLDHLASYPTRMYNTETGVQSATWIYEQARRYSASCGSTVDVEFFQHSWMQPSVIARMQGTSRPDEVIVWGAHQDSINILGGNAPGYDDDGTGSMNILEGLKAVCASGVTFARTVEFQWYAAEEVGLLGSGAVAAQYAATGVNVVSMLQHDMTCYNPTTSSDYNTIGIIEDYTDPSMNDFMRDIIDEYTSPNITHRGSLCGYGCSDHASFTSAGYPSSFTFEKPFGSQNPLIHTTRDTKDLCDSQFMFEFMRMGAGFLVEAAN